MKKQITRFINDHVIANQLRIIKEKYGKFPSNATQQTQKHALFLVLGGDKKTFLVSVLLASELSKEGWKISMLVCDGLPACERLNYTNTSKSEFFDDVVNKRTCQSCYINTTKLAKKILNLNTILLSDYQFKPSDQATEHPEKQDIVSAASLSNSVRFQAHIPNVDDSFDRDITARYAQAGEMAFDRIENCLRAEKPSIVVSHHGIYMPMGLLPRICAELKIKYLCWNFGYKKHSILFSPNESYHKTLPETHIEDIDETPSAQEIVEVRKYYKSKINGETDWISFYDKSKNNSHRDRALLEKLANYSNVELALTNVSWDAFVNQFGQNLPFENQVEWLNCFIANALKNPKNAYVIKIHPAEDNHPLPAAIKTERLIRDKYENLPKNVYLIGASSKISSYSLISLASRCHVFSSKIGLECIFLGKQITISGDAWTRNKNIGTDIKTEEEFTQILSKQEPRAVTEQEFNNALKFAKFLLYTKHHELRCLSDKIMSGNVWDKTKFFDKTNVPLSNKERKKLLKVFEIVI